jgi:hypothetical protein
VKDYEKAASKQPIEGEKKAAKPRRSRAAKKTGGKKKTSTKRSKPKD